MFKLGCLKIGQHKIKFDMINFCLFILCTLSLMKILLDVKPWHTIQHCIKICSKILFASQFCKETKALFKIFDEKDILKVFKEKNEKKNFEPWNLRNLKCIFGNLAFEEAQKFIDFYRVPGYKDGQMYAF